MSKEENNKLLQILVNSDTIKGLKRQALNEDIDSHRAYAAKLLTKVVELISAKKISIEIDK